MKDLQIKTNPGVELVFNNYPDSVRSKMLSLRGLVIETAKETEGIAKLEETLKWGEPSYLTAKSKSGSTIRIAWKESQEEHYSMYFK